MPVTLRTLHAANEREIRELAAVLIDCVDGGASVSFMTPLSEPKAIAFWRSTVADCEAGRRVIVVAETDTRIVGTVQVILAQPENQPHRADVAKMLVHRAARRHGIGELLIRAAEDAARAAGKSLLVLDTADAAAERLYRRCGWQFAGTIPDYALWPTGGKCPTSFFYRPLC
jgi:GNAT superfamily N-acetyltransferase